MAHVFISYSHKDSDFAELLRRQLEYGGISTWLDTEQLTAGDEWRDAIDGAIRGALAVIVIMTPEARGSEFVTYEWSCAWGAGIPLIPVLLKPTELHPRLEAIQYFNFSDKLKQPWDKLFDRLNDVVGAAFTVSAPYDAPRYVREYARLLDMQHDPGEIAKVIDALTNTDDPAALEVLASATKHRNRGVRYPAALALARSSNYTDRRCVPAMLELIEKRNWKSPELGTMANNTGVSVGLLTVGLCISEIGKLKDSRAMPALVKLLDEEDEALQCLAIRALGDMGDISISPLLVQMLVNPRPDMFHQDYRKVSYEAVVALGKLRDINTLEQLIGSLGTNKYFWRSTIEDAIKAFENAAIDMLVDKLNDHSMAYKDEGREYYSSSPVSWSTVASRILKSIDTPESMLALNAWRASRGLSPISKIGDDIDL